MVPVLFEEKMKKIYKFIFSTATALANGWGEDNLAG
jgi:hypothetical protein